MKFYGIGQVAEIVDVSSQSLRLWESQGLIPAPHRTATKHRRYTGDDVEVIKRFLENRFKDN